MVNPVKPQQKDEKIRQIWITLLPRLSRVDRRQLLKEIRLRLWRARLLTLRRFPVSLKLGLSYSMLVFLTIVLIPLPQKVSLFIPLLIGAVGCLAINLVFLFNLVISLLMHQLKLQVPPFNGLESCTIDELFLQSQENCHQNQSLWEDETRFVD